METKNGLINFLKIFLRNFTTFDRDLWQKSFIFDRIAEGIRFYKYELNVIPCNLITQNYLKNSLTFKIQNILKILFSRSFLFDVLIDVMTSSRMSIEITFRPIPELQKYKDFQNVLIMEIFINGIKIENKHFDFYEINEEFADGIIEREDDKIVLVII